MRGRYRHAAVLIAEPGSTYVAVPPDSVEQGESFVRRFQRFDRGGLDALVEWLIVCGVKYRGHGVNGC